MKKIFYSMAGEGRGHAMRALTLIENLKYKYEIHIYAPGQAYELLHPFCRANDVCIKRIPGLTFHYDSKKRVNIAKTLVESVKFFFRRPETMKSVCRDFEKQKPGLVITDFEAILPKAAEKTGVPYISINHQHFLAHCRLNDLPFYLRNRAVIAGPLLSLFHMNQIATIISSFYSPELKPFSGKGIHQVGVFLNSAILNAKTENRGFVLVYLRRFLSRKILSALEKCGEKVTVYSSQSHDNYKNIRFKKISQYGFAEDLAKCSMLVTTAGNQLVGEALYLGKKIIAVPEPNNFEQEINGFFLEKSGGGKCITTENFTDDTVFRFLRDRDMFRCTIPQEDINGNDKALKLITSYINGRKINQFIDNFEKRLIS